MKNFLVLSCYLCMLCQIASSQNIVIETWSDKPSMHTIDPKMKDESAVIILDKRRVEYYDEKENLLLYKTLHKIIHINDDKGIASFNRVYLPVSNNADILDIQARTILPSGKTIEVNKSSIKDLKEEDGNTYKIFAMEGLEPGCEIEFYYTYKRNTSFFGSEVFQGKYPVLEAQFELVAPQRLIFEMKPYNSDAAFTDAVRNDKKWITIIEKDIPEAESEKYCALEANLKRFEYKLSYNKARNNNDRLFTWDELAKRIYTNITTCNDKEIKRVNDLIENMKLNHLSTEQEKIVAVENYLKTNFAGREDLDSDDANNLEKIIKTKLASHFGIVRLYGAVFRQMNIPHEYVLAADRDKNSIERNFENWNNCENYLIYFPSQKKYLAPTLSEYRFPWINPKWGNTNVLHCRTTTIGNFTTALGDVKMLSLEDYSRTLVNIEAEVRLNPMADTLLIQISQIFSGYAAATYKAIFNFSSEEDKKEITKEMIKFGTKSENIVTSRMENRDFESYNQNKPFVLSATVKASELVEKAGNKTIVKIGDIIGPQVEMYQEKPRQFPMEIEFPHVLQRKINFIIPDGYVIKNPDDIKISHTYQDKGQTTMGFTSTYQIEGNILKITIQEEYRRTNYPLNQFDEFRKVINAAADFNKVVLVLEKK